MIALRVFEDIAIESTVMSSTTFNAVGVGVKTEDEREGFNVRANDGTFDDGEGDDAVGDDEDGVGFVRDAHKGILLVADELNELLHKMTGYVPHKTIFQMKASDL